MGLRATLSATPETMSDFAVAAEERFWEGLELAGCDRPGTAIYLLGYAAEMWLKVAAFQFDGARASDPVQPRLVPAKVWLAGRPENVPHESYHSLVFWMRYLLARRRVAGRRLPGVLAGEFTHHVRRLHGLWWVGMRYRPDRASERDVERMFRAASWVRQNFELLWR